ncbi:putative leucine rich repeat protein [Phytophthora cinnamomi]|uniref:putative leucine rich repeat protein n=1 Tax=Phytophthora cinnamomi TaxID=4785 RepID=UPI00355A8679|nr:putative leucine rich repeat protein [Phytophthora cinnamomi]
MLALTRELAAQIAADHPALQSLNLSSNALADVRHLQLLPRSLAQLDLGENRLAALPPELGAWLPALRLLRLRGNALESLRPLAVCARLQTLDAGANRLALLSELRFLQPLAQLRHLALDGNPLAASAAYRREVLAMLPQLQTLDGKEVTAAERLYAKLQLKTQMDGGAASPAASPAPSPTRLLTPESLQRNAGEKEVAAASAAAALRVEVDAGRREEEEERQEWSRQSGGDSRQSKVELNMSAMTERQPSPLMLASMGVPAASATVLLTSERSERYRPATRQEHLENDSLRQKHKLSGSYVRRAFGGDFVSRPRGIHAASSNVETREMLLKNRVDALEAIMAVQDKTMKKTLARFGERKTESQIIMSVKNGNGVAPTAEAAAAVYTQLLAAWREKCVALMVQARSSELAHERCGSSALPTLRLSEIWRL